MKTTRFQHLPWTWLKEKVKNSVLSCNHAIKIKITVTVFVVTSPSIFASSLKNQFHEMVLWFGNKW
jgi:hypothetical protein